MRVVLGSALAITLLVACGGNGGRPSEFTSAVPVEGGLPAGFPDDFPLYPDLDVVRSTPMGRRYIIEAKSQDLPADVVAFYAEELGSGRWEVLGREESSEPATSVFLFTAPGFIQEGKVIVVEDTAAAGKAAVGIVLPFEALEGE